MNHPISIAILDGPLPPLPPISILGAGALLTFEGIVRPLEDGREILALDYQVYEPMATAQLTLLAGDLALRHGLLHLTTTHSRGIVPVHRPSFQLQLSAPHRREALAAMTEFIDRLKQDVPIWKTPVWRT